MQLFGNFVILIDLRRKLENYILNFNLYADYDSDDYRYGSFIMHFFQTWHETFNSYRHRSI